MNLLWTWWMDSNSATITVIDLGISDSSIYSNKCSLFLILFHSFHLYISPVLPVLRQTRLLIFFMARFYLTFSSFCIAYYTEFSTTWVWYLVVSQNFLETIVSLSQHKKLISWSLLFFFFCLEFICLFPKAVLSMMLPYWIIHSWFTKSMHWTYRNAFPSFTLTK